MAKDEHTGRKFALGAILAGIVGYFAGILTAPKSGKETRQEIKSETAEQLKAAQADLEKLIGQTKSKSVALNAKAREQYNEAVVKAKDAKNKAGNVIKGVKSGGSDNPDLDEALKQAKLAYNNLAKYLKS